MTIPGARIVHLVNSVGRIYGRVNHSPFLGRRPGLSGEPYVSDLAFRDIAPFLDPRTSGDEIPQSLLRTEERFVGNNNLTYPIGLTESFDDLHPGLARLKRSGRPQRSAPRNQHDCRPNKSTRSKKAIRPDYALCPPPASHSRTYPLGKEKIDGSATALDCQDPDLDSNPGNLVLVFTSASISPGSLKPVARPPHPPCRPPTSKLGRYYETVQDPQRTSRVPGREPDTSCRSQRLWQGAGPGPSSV